MSFPDIPDHNRKIEIKFGLFFQKIFGWLFQDLPIIAYSFEIIQASISWEINLRFFPKKYNDTNNRWIFKSGRFETQLDSELFEIDFLLAVWSEV